MGIGESDGEWRDQLCSKGSQFLCETAATEGGASITEAPTTLGATIVCSSTCDAGWEQTDDCLCYQVQNDLRTWLDARTACNDLKTGATLISLTSEAVELKVLEMFGGFSSGTGLLDDPDTNIMPNHAKAAQNCVKMKFVADDSGNLEKAGWDDIDCAKKPIKSVCQYSVL